ncbi:hypothetical protein GOP47_0011861, partial [Adiantum capillus-veneris]
NVQNFETLSLSLSRHLLRPLQKGSLQALSLSPHAGGQACFPRQLGNGFSQPAWGCCLRQEQQLNSLGQGERVTGHEERERCVQRGSSRCRGRQRGIARGCRRSFGIFQANEFISLVTRLKILARDIGSDRCSGCKKASEDLSHLFKQCSTISGPAGKLCKWVQKTWNVGFYMKDLFFGEMVMKSQALLIYVQTVRFCYLQHF